MIPARKRGRWLQAFRLAHLAEHPLCEHCQHHGRVRLATEVDHRLALHNGGQDFDVAPDNAQSLCADCHRAKSIEDMGNRPKVKPHASWA